MPRVCAVCHLPWFLEMIHWLCLPVLILVFPLLILFTLIENSNLEKIELCATIHTFFNELQPIYISAPSDHCSKATLILQIPLFLSFCTPVTNGSKASR